MVGDPHHCSPKYSYLTLPLSLVFDLCFVDSLRRRRDLIVKLESEGWPYEELRERAPPNLPDGYDGYNTLNAFFAVALLGILIPMALQRCVCSSCCQPQVKSELTYTSLDNHLAPYPSYFVAKLLKKASKKRQLDTELLTGYTGITVMMLTLTLTLTQTLTLYDNPYYTFK